MIVYKAEAYEKFQILLYRLKFDVTAYIAGIDFAQVHQQDQGQQVIVANSQSEAEYLKMLQKVSAEIPEIQQIAKAPDTMVYENSEGVEIFEVNDSNQPVGTPVVDSDTVSHKTRPNDPCPCGSGKKYKKCCGIK